MGCKTFNRNEYEKVLKKRKRNKDRQKFTWKLRVKFNAKWQNNYTENNKKESIEK